MKARCGQVVSPEAGVRGRIRRLPARAQAARPPHDRQVVTRALGQAGQRATPRLAGVVTS